MVEVVVARSRIEIPPTRHKAADARDRTSSVQRTVLENAQPPPSPPFGTNQRPEHPNAHNSQLQQDPARSTHRTQLIDDQLEDVSVGDATVTHSMRMCNALRTMWAEANDRRGGDEDEDEDDDDEDEDSGVLAHGPSAGCRQVMTAARSAVGLHQTVVQLPQRPGSLFKLQRSPPAISRDRRRRSEDMDVGQGQAGATRRRGLSVAQRISGKGRRGSLTSAAYSPLRTCPRHARPEHAPRSPQ
ncbi:hypothetical protein V8D89_003257 [Ganoderma adspersum]